MIKKDARKEYTRFWRSYRSGTRSLSNDIYWQAAVRSMDMREQKSENKYQFLVNAHLRQLYCGNLALISMLSSFSLRWDINDNQRKIAIRLIGELAQLEYKHCA